MKLKSDFYWNPCTHKCVGIVVEGDNNDRVDLVGEVRKLYSNSLGKGMILLRVMKDNQIISMSTRRKDTLFHSPLINSGLDPQQTIHTRVNSFLTMAHYLVTNS